MSGISGTSLETEAFGNGCPSRAVGPAGERDRSLGRSSTWVQLRPMGQGLSQETKTTKGVMWTSSWTWSQVQACLISAGSTTSFLTSSAQRSM